ncbi:glycosyltransferase family 4 protein [Novosphingobium resinovorum]|uniref:glycosyltransferase family 4 protein n=1 Tax=Novosphingobium resinovorum TaxID=158500 RepID=UPI002ED6451A|nr:glycosyltransferase family 4 protein [Novosphingobium resinovorum]
MHIGLCSPHWPPSQGANGIVTYVSQVREYLLSRGHDVSIVAQGRLIAQDGTVTPLQAPGGAAQSFDDQSFGVRWFGAKAIGALGRRIAWRFDRSSGALAPLGRMLAREVAQAHRIRRFDVFEMEESFGWSAFVGKAIDAPVVTRLHGPHAVRPPSPRSEAELQSDEARCRAEARAIRAAPVLTAPTRAVLDVLCAQARRDPASVSLAIPNPIRIDPEAPTWSLDTCEPDHVLMVGRFDYWKGADTMLLAFDRLLDTRPNARLTLVGPDDGIDSHGRRVGFETFVAENLSLRARERITFTGQLEAGQIAPLRRKAMVTVCASREESFSYVLLEGMVAGCPLISTAWPASREVIVDGESGMLTPIADPPALAASLERMLADPQRAAAMGAAARERARRCFAIEVVGARLIDCYETAIEAAAAERAAGPVATLQ